MNLMPVAVLCIDLSVLFLVLGPGTGHGHSVRDVIEASRRVAKHEIPTEIGERRPGDPPELIADSTLAQKLLEWQPRYTDLESIIETAWRWHSTHPNGYGARP